jgi:hypothetical protein
LKFSSSPTFFSSLKPYLNTPVNEDEFLFHKDDHFTLSDGV